MLKNSNTYEDVEKYLAIYIFLSMLLYPIESLLGLTSIDLLWNLSIFLGLIFMNVFKSSWSDRYKVNIVGVCLGIGLILIQLISFFRSNVVLGDNKYLSANINIFISGLNVMLIFGVFNSIKISSKGITYIARMCVIFCLVSCFYNFLINGSKMINIANMSTAYTYSFHSFFGNKNLYGFILLYGIICNTFLFINCKSKKIGYILVYVILATNLITTLSRNSILGTVIFMCVFILLINKRKKFRKIILIFSGVLCILLIFTNESLRSFIEEFIIRKNYGLTTRDILWNVSLESLNRTNSWVWGLGLGQIGQILENYTYVASVHNFYLEIILGGGLIKLGFYLLIIIYSFNKSVKIYKIDRANGSVFIALTIAYLVYGMFESTSILGIGIMSNLCTIFMIVLPIMYNNYIAHDKGAKE